MATARRPNGVIRILLAYRHTLLRQALKTLLANEPDLVVVAESHEGRETVEKAEQCRPDIILIDAQLGIVDGIEVTRLIRKRLPEARILLLAHSAADDYVVDALRAGAVGCLLKDADASELSLAIRTAQRGNSYLSPAISERIVQSYLRVTDAAPARPERGSLSVREREILQFVADGMENREIAENLFLSVKTVEAHKAHIKRKLNARSRVDLIKYAIRVGLIELDATPAFSRI